MLAQQYIPQELREENQGQLGLRSETLSEKEKQGENKNPALETQLSWWGVWPPCIKLWDNLQHTGTRQNSSTAAIQGSSSGQPELGETASLTNGQEGSVERTDY